MRYRLGEMPLYAKVLGAASVFVLVLAIFGPMTVLADGVCQQGGNWSGHQSPPLRKVDGAVEYCVKGGSSQSQGCDGYLETGSFEQVKNVVNDDDACGLSHWSYRLGDPTKTPKPPTHTPVTPTDTKTPKPPTETDTPVPPTETDTPVPPTLTKTPRPPTHTNTPRPPTATDTPIPPTATDTSVPPTSTPTDKPPEKKKTPTPTPTATVKVKTPTPSPSITPSATSKCDWYFSKLVCGTPECGEDFVGEGCYCPCGYGEMGDEVWAYIHIDDEAMGQIAHAVDWGSDDLVEALNSIQFEIDQMNGGLGDTYGMLARSQAAQLQALEDIRQQLFLLGLAILLSTGAMGALYYGVNRQNRNGRR